jgi:4-amino-4-deoxy-L-arabinose transferase-like glycosyltransferase
MSTHTTTSPANHRDWVRPLLILALVTAVLMTFQLDGTPFRGIYDDVDRSLIARNMVDSGDWLVATYVWGPLYTKPPLMYWTAAAIGTVTGRSDELPGNLASVAGMFMLVLATFWAGRNLLGTRAGLWAGLLLVTMHLFLAMSRQALLDTVMMGGFGLAFGALIHLGYSATPHSTRWWLLTAFGLSLAFMTKGPVILPIFLLIWLPMVKGNPRLRPRLGQVAAALGLIVAMTLPWPLALLKAAPEAAEVWHSELFGRFGDGQQFHAWTQKPVWFYLPDLANTMPWLPLLIWAVVGAFRSRQQENRRLLLWWALGGLIFFSVASATKRSYYLLPLYPAFALLIAARWDDLVRQIRSGRWIPLLGLITVLVLGVAMAILPLAISSVPRVPFLIGGVLTTVAAGMAIFFSRHARWTPALFWVIGAAACLHLTYFGWFVPRANAFHSGKPFFTEARPLIGDRPVILLETHLTLSVFYLHEVPWAYARKEKFLQVAEENPGALVVADPALAARFPRLVPVLVKELTEPLGKKRKLGLYQMVQPQP